MRSYDIAERKGKTGKRNRRKKRQKTFTKVDLKFLCMKKYISELYCVTKS